MRLVFNICLESGETHPRERELQQSAIAHEVLALISKNEELWCNPEITYQFPAEGAGAEALGCLRLSGITLSAWFYVYEIEMSPEAFDKPVLSDELKEKVERYRVIYGKELKLPGSYNEANCEEIVSIYFQYLRDLRTKCKELDIPFSQSDRILFNTDSRVNKKITLKNYGRSAKE